VLSILPTPSTRVALDQRPHHGSTRDPDHVGGHHCELHLSVLQDLGSG
jgi:hypothetical protein